VNREESISRLPRWLRIYIRFWYLFALPLAIGLFVFAAYADDKFYVMLSSAVGGATVAFLFQAVSFGLYFKRRRPSAT
jgi:hypothetical protein